MSMQVSKKFNKFDEDHDGMIDKAQFGHIIKSLDLNLSPMIMKQYIDVNFKFVDRNLQGRISCGAFLACLTSCLALLG
jgi:Ca2+-binding EF-hand superfamily protein